MLSVRDRELDLAIDDAIYFAGSKITCETQTDAFIERLNEFGYEIVKRGEENAED